MSSKSYKNVPERCKKQKCPICKTTVEYDDFVPETINCRKCHCQYYARIVFKKVTE